MATLDKTLYSARARTMGIAAHQVRRCSNTARGNVDLAVTLA